MKETLTAEQQELITIKEAGILLKRSPKSIRQYIQMGYLEPIRQNVTKVYLKQVLTLKKMFEEAGKSISPFGDLVLEKDESIKFLDMLNDPHSISNPYKYMTRCKYGVTNKGRIINLTLNHVLTPQTVDHDYQQVRIGKRLELVHRAVASQWCSNGKFKSKIHHIDGDKANNHAVNLIFVTDEEHDEAHRLLEVAKLSNNWQEYNTFINAIRKDNQWTEDIRVILDPEDGEDCKDWHVWFVCKQGYVDYKSGVKSWDDLFANGDIRAEGYYSK